ncbi:glycosyltransferase family 4 protein [Sphingomonas sp. ac-8]|uniref:glycosyltransferase family 4 protein n=1 Tax=Sphingomonas sp. ac-8 TaxID=3242977 RepID=UPI003A810428
MRIAIVSDAWAPQVNGVVRTLAATVDELRSRGHLVEMVTPDGFVTWACPGYREIRLAFGQSLAVGHRLDRLRPQAVHIATEGPLGWAARRWCLDRAQRFTTSFHTNFPDYLALRTGLPARCFWPAIRRFHRPASAVLAATASVADKLARHGILHSRPWSRGVDGAVFRPDGPRLAIDGEGPVLLHVGRIAVEKNLEAFLALDVPGTKLVVGDGPARAMLAQRYPQARFLGTLHGAALAAAYRAADVLVFPSRTDTFGLVMIEALACGTPVAGYPVEGPADVLGRAGTGMGGIRIGAVDVDLARAVTAARTADRAACAAEGARYDWSACTDQFLAHLAAEGPALAS